MTTCHGLRANYLVKLLCTRQRLEVVADSRLGKYLLRGHICMHSNLDAFSALAMVVVHVFYDIGVSSKSRRDHSRTLTTATVVEIYLLEKVSSDWTRPRAWTRSMRLRVHRGLVFAVSTRKFR